MDVSGPLHIDIEDANFLRLVSYREHLVQIRAIIVAMHEVVLDELAVKDFLKEGGDRIPTCSN